MEAKLRHSPVSALSGTTLLEMLVHGAVLD